MAIVNEYVCGRCGLELVDDGRVFIWDGNETKDFLILMNTHQLLHGAEITGDVIKTYCRKCDRFLKIYSISEVNGEIENPVEVVEEGIKNHIARLSGELVEMKKAEINPEFSVNETEDGYLVEFPGFEHLSCRGNSRVGAVERALEMFHDDIDELIDSRLEEYSDYVRSNYLVLDDRCNERDPSQKVECPACGLEVPKYVDCKSPCPKCVGDLLLVNTLCYD